MPIYEYYCQENHTIYQFFAKTLAQAQCVPACPENPGFHMERIMSAFAITGKQDKSAQESPADGAGSGSEAEDPRMEAALGAMEREFSSVDENDPRAMGRMMRRMAELTGERIDGEMEEVVRKLEEGTDPEKLEEQLGGGEAGQGGEGDDAAGGPGMGQAGPEAPVPKEPRHRYRQRRQAPFRDPRLFDY